MCDQQSLRSACAYGQSDQNPYWSLEYSTSVKLLTEHHLKFLSLKGGCTGSSEATLVKMPHFRKSHVTCFSYLSICYITANTFIRETTVGSQPMKIQSSCITGNQPIHIIVLILHSPKIEKMNITR